MYTTMEETRDVHKKPYGLQSATPELPTTPFECQEYVLLR